MKSLCNRLNELSDKNLAIVYGLFLIVLFIILKVFFKA